MKKSLILGLVLFLGACSSVTVRTDDANKVKSTPDFQQSYDYWWWGLKGEHTVNVREICQGNKVEQMQAVNTLSDMFYTVITLGIYQARTARVWCEGESNG